MVTETLLFADLGDELFDEFEDGLHAVLITELDGFKDFLVRHLSGTDLDHVDAVLVPREDQIDIRELELRVRGVDDVDDAVFRVDATNTNRRGRAFEWRVRDREDRGCCGTCDDIRIVLAVVAHDPTLDLDLFDEPVGEQWADRAIDHAHREDFLLVGSALTLAEPAGELAARGQLLAVIDLHGEEVEPRTRISADERGTNGGLAVRHQDIARCEFGDLPGLDPHCAAADFLLDDNSFTRSGHV